MPGRGGWFPPSRPGHATGARARQNGYSGPMGASTLSTDMTDAREPAPDRPRGRAVVIAGASAGGVEALVRTGELAARGLPARDADRAARLADRDERAARDPRRARARCPSALPPTARSCSAGHVYVAPPDSHLVVEDSRLRLSQAPRENGHRPAIDPTMRTAANAYGGATIGIVLSGSRDDGTAGLMAIKASGGIAIVQDPDEALYPAMPLQRHRPCRARRGPADRGDGALDPRARPSDESGTHEQQLAHEPHAPRATPPLGSSTHLAVVDTEDDPPGSATGEGTRYTCPDCGGVLFERREGLLERFECSVGHVFSIESLSSAQADALENALWAAVRSLEDRAALLRRLAVGGRDGRRVALGGRVRATRPTTRSSARARSARPSRAPPTTARSRLSRERAGRAPSLGGRVRDAARRPARAPQAHARLRLHAATSARASSAGSASGWTRSRSATTASTSTTSRSTRTSSPRSSTRSSSTSRGSSATRRPGTTCADDVVPRLLEAAAPTTPIRVWCAGCASGEEAYTLAMVLAEALGDDGVHASA